MTTVGNLQDLPKGRGLVLLLASSLGLFAGLCTLFASVVTAAQAWQDHAHEQWPEAAARVRQCSLDVYTHNPDSYWIDCTVRYTVAGKEIFSHVHSRTTPAPRRVIWEYPRGKFERLQEWVDAHPEGTPIAVHYDPAKPSQAVLVATDMPLGGPQTPSNLKLLGIAAGSCVVLLAIARIMRPRPAAMNGD